MKKSEIKDLTTKEIEEKIEESKRMLVRMRLNHVVSPLENPQKLKLQKKEVARLLTELRSRALKEKKKS